MIITIGRQIGSGGYEIGEKLAEKLNFSFYDKNLLALAAKESGFCEEEFIKIDEKKKLWSGFLFNTYLGQGNVTFNNTFSNEKMFHIQSKTIAKIASSEDCVIMGRCADYVLRERKDCIKVFITSVKEDCINRISQRKNIDEKQAEDFMNKTNKSRSEYYNFYTDKLWGEAASYDLCVNSSVLGIENTVNLIFEMISGIKK